MVGIAGGAKEEPLHSLLQSPFPFVRIRLKPSDEKFLDLFADKGTHRIGAPPPKQPRDLHGLLKPGAPLVARRIPASLLRRDELGEGQVLGAHFQGLCPPVHCRLFVDVGGSVGLAEEAQDKVGHMLATREKTLGVENAGRRVDVAGEVVDVEDMRRQLGRVLEPVC